MRGSAFEDRTLAVQSPAIAATWHPTQNSQVTPDDVTFRSRFRAWWQCPDHPDHVWVATVHARHRSGCPYCTGHRVRKTGPRHTCQGDFATTNPALVREWLTAGKEAHRRKSQPAAIQAMLRHEDLRTTQRLLAQTRRWNTAAERSLSHY